LKINTLFDRLAARPYLLIGVGLGNALILVSIPFIVERSTLLTLFFVYLVGVTAGVYAFRIQLINLRKGVQISSQRLQAQKKRLIHFSRSVLNREKHHKQQLLQIESLNEELKLMSSAVAQAPVSIVVTNRLGAIQFVNKRFCEISGYNESEVFGQNPRVLKSGTHTTHFYRNMWETILNDRKWRGLLCNRRKNGELYWENATICPIKNHNGQITHLIGVKEDVTRQKMMEKMLRDEEEIFETVFEYLPGAALLLSSPDLRVLAVNQLAQKYLEVEINDLKGQSLQDWQSGLSFEEGEHTWMLNAPRTESGQKEFKANLTYVLTEGNQKILVRLENP